MVLTQSSSETLKIYNFDQLGHNQHLFLSDYMGRGRKLNRWRLPPVCQSNRTETRVWSANLDRIWRARDSWWEFSKVNQIMPIRCGSLFHSLYWKWDRELDVDNGIVMPLLSCCSYVTVKETVTNRLICEMLVSSMLLWKFFLCMFRIHRLLNIAKYK